jgi:tRNA pseudouridine55 synthase
LAAQIGWRDQVPPNTSNKRVGGERAYVKAHRGETFELPPAQVYLHEAAWLDHDLAQGLSRVRLVARGGYYIRSLARDLGRALGCGAHLSALHRSAIGPYADPPPGAEVAVVGPDALPWLETRELSDFELGELRANRPIPVKEVRPPTWPLPAGFPGDPKPVVRALHKGRLTHLLEREGEGLLKGRVELGRGV